jgi:uncharacterized protein
MTMHIAYPYHIDQYGRTATTDEISYIRQLIEQVLFTMPGERVNRPDFGSPLMQLVFSATNDELVTTYQFLMRSALQQWLGDLIEIESVQTSMEDTNLMVTISYILKQTQQRQSEHFKYESSL